MRTIHKGNEPACVTELRSSGGGFGGLSGACKAEVRRALAKEQRHLCCYCLSRIEPDDARMKVEHWLPQSDPEQGKQGELAWDNLFGACRGGEGSPPSMQHCDTRKGDQYLSLRPTDPTCGERIRYLPDGTVRSDDKELQVELDQVLNLNLKRLQRNREATLDGFLDAAKRSSDKNWTRARIERWLDELAEPERLQEHVQIVVHFLERRLARS
ncbi:MAG: TIGR02646 family protein [Myxococcales bacterium]